MGKDREEPVSCCETTGEEVVLPSQGGLGVGFVVASCLHCIKEFQLLCISCCYLILSPHRRNFLALPTRASPCPCHFPSGRLRCYSVLNS